MQTPIVQTRALSKAYGDFQALSGCSLDVEAGEVLGLLGPNGAGKSTLIRLLLGFLRPTKGEAKINGLDCYRDRAKVHQLLSYLPGDARLSRLMSGNRVLEFFASLRPDASLDRARQIADRLDLDLRRWVGMMSTGMRQKLAIALTVAIEAPLLILDEPTANLDPSVRGEVLELVKEAKAGGRTVIFSSHVLSEIEEVCDRVCILRGGRLVHEQSLDVDQRSHFVEAEIVGELPDLPEGLASTTQVRRRASSLEIEVAGELTGVMHWLAAIPVKNIYVRQIGLRAVYDRFHAPKAVGESATSSVGVAE